MNTHVYCTNCIHLVLGIDDIPRCKFENKCNIWDCNDSKPFAERPYYKERKIVTCKECMFLYVKDFITGCCQNPKSNETIVEPNSSCEYGKLKRPKGDKKLWTGSKLETRKNVKL